MKHLIKISELFGAEIRTRSSLDDFQKSLVKEDDYLFDMSGIEMISRSAADELYNIVHEYNVEIVHMTSFVQQMYDSVTIGRFNPRQHSDNDVVFIKCEDFNQLKVWSGSTSGKFTVSSEKDFILSESRSGEFLESSKK